ncbi:MAG TPA: secondary thiamine-phosphate synthase enzyme YjbQ [Ignavibacteria bacterium]
MKIISEEIIKKTKGNCDIINITNEIETFLSKSKITNGVLTIFSIGSTGGVSTVEYEPGLLKDIKIFFDKILPSALRYNHDDTWGDGNGHSHLRSFLVKTSLSVPVIKGELTLGTWQQVVFIDFDNRPRTRRIVFQIMGE